MGAGWGRRRKLSSAAAPAADGLQPGGTGALEHGHTREANSPRGKEAGLLPSPPLAAGRGVSWPGDGIWVSQDSTSALTLTAPNTRRQVQRSSPYADEKTEVWRGELLWQGPPTGKWKNQD